MKKIFIYIWIFIFLIVGFISTVNFYVLSFSGTNYYYKVDWLAKNYVWLVFWASIISNDVPSDILKDRLKVAYQAYSMWKIEKIIVSWATDIGYSEPDVMKKYLIKLWVDSDDIYVDYAWLDTYDSLYRAKEIFGVNKIVLFTQDFHLKRAMYIGNKLWIETFWVETNLHKYMWYSYNNIREIFARVKAFLDVEIIDSKPKYLGDKIEIITDEKIEKAKKMILENKK